MRPTLEAMIAKKKHVEKDTDKHAEIGIMKDVRGEIGVHTFTRTLRHQEEDIKGAAEVPVTTPTQEDPEVETDTDVEVNNAARADKEV